MARILVADDKELFRADAKKMLGNGREFEIILATNPEEALHCLESSDIEVAIIDLRLRGGSEYDTSGLDVAARSSQLIPIIMVSQFEDQEAIMEAINTRPDGYPLVVRFLSKQDISDQPELLRTTVRTALKKRELWSKTEREKVNPQLLKHYNSDRSWSHIYQGLHYLTSFAFVGLMIYVSLDVGAKIANLAFAMAAIIAGEFTNILISRREGSIARRADKNHSEILQAARFSQLFDACSAISDLEERDKARYELITTAATNWLVPETKTKTRLLGSKSAGSSDDPPDQ
jgi:DNA-binding NarL/FixJ family response regulator